MTAKKKWLIIVLSVFLPCSSFAGLDILSIAQDTLTSFQEKMNLVIKQYVGIQANLQEMTLNRDAINKLREQVKTELEMRASEFYNTSKGEALEFLRSKTSYVTLSGVPLADAAGVASEAWPGLDLGAYVSPELKKQIGEVYMQRKNIDNDVQASLYNDLRINSLTNENIARLYSNGLVHRLRIMEEEKKLEEITTSDKTKDNDERFENTDVNLIIDQYARVARQANHRWLEIKDFKASYIKMLREAELSKVRVEDVSDVTGQEEDKKQKEDMKSAFDVGTNSIGDNLKNVTLTEQFKRGIEAIKSGNYSSALGTVTETYSQNFGTNAGVGSVLNNISTGAAMGQNVLNSTQGGNWQSVLGETSNILTQSGYGNVINESNNALNNALRGDWEGAYNSLNSGNTSAQEQAKAAEQKSQELQEKAKEGLQSAAKELKKLQEQEQSNQLATHTKNIVNTLGGKK